MSNLWTEKYRPKSIDEILGNDLNIKWIKNWIKFFETKDGFKNFKNGLVISGPPGVGKTTIASLALKSFGYDVMEINASEVRKVAVIKDKFKSIVNCSNIQMMFK